VAPEAGLVGHPWYIVYNKSCRKEPDEERPPEKPRPTWEDNKTNLNDTRYEDVDFVSQLTGCFEHNNKLSGFIKCGDFLNN
jgi:hypothetical protein